MQFAKLTRYSLAYKCEIIPFDLITWTSIHQFYKEVVDREYTYKDTDNSIERGETITISYLASNLQIVVVLECVGLVGESYMLLLMLLSLKTEDGLSLVLILGDVGVEGTLELGEVGVVLLVLLIFGLLFGEIEEARL